VAKTKREPSENLTPPPGGRTFRPDTGKLLSLEKGEEVRGVFIGVQNVTIKDKRTKLPKELFVLKLRDETTNEIQKLPCAAMMLHAWGDIVDEYGNGDEPAAIQQLRNKVFVINRGDDMKTTDGNQMGTYSVTIID